MSAPKPTLVYTPADPNVQRETSLPPLKFGSVEEFVTKYLARVYTLDVTQTHRRKWCPQWWRHGGVTARLEGVWRAWEHYRQEASVGMFVWFLETDKHIAWLMATDGPFELCSVKEGHLSHTPGEGGRGLPPLPVQPATPPFADQRITHGRAGGQPMPEERRIAALAFADLDTDDGTSEDPTENAEGEPYDVD